MRTARAAVLTRVVLLFLVAGCASNTPPTALEPSPSRTPGPSSAAPGLTTVPAPSPAEAFSLIVVNVDGPPVDVLVNGTLVLQHAACYLNDDYAPPALTPTMAFPWHIEVRDARGASLGSFVENGNEGPKAILVRWDGATLIPRGANPGQAPKASCAS